MVDIITLWERTEAMRAVEEQDITQTHHPQGRKVVEIVVIQFLVLRARAREVEVELLLLVAQVQVQEVELVEQAQQIQ